MNAEEITPLHLRCSVGMCPSVFKLADGNLLIIGKRPTELSKEIAAKVAPDEEIVIISPEYFAQIFSVAAPTS